MPKDKLGLSKRCNEKNRSKKEGVRIVDLVLAQPHTYELMQINPEITMNALHAIEESGQYESFLRLSKTLKLKSENLRTLSNVRDLNEMIHRVTNTLQIFASNASTMGFLCEHLLRSTRKCQVFIRKALARRRREREFIKNRWIAVQEKARRQVEIVVKDRVKRLKNTQSQAILEDTWGVLIDCYASPEDMEAAIVLFFKENSIKYLMDFRQYRKQARAAAQSSSELSSTQRRKYREAILKYPAMCEVRNLSPSIAELCVYLDHAHNLESLSMAENFGKDTEGREGGGVVAAGEIPSNSTGFEGIVFGEEDESPRGAFLLKRKKIKRIFAPTISVLPVSYYHSLISLSPRDDFQLLLALRALNSAGDQKYLNRVNGPSRQVIQRAVGLKQKWNVMHGRHTITSISDTPSANTTKVDQFGQPKSCINCGPVVAKRPTSPSLLNTIRPHTRSGVSPARQLENNELLNSRSERMGGGGTPGSSAGMRSMTSTLLPNGISSRSVRSLFSVEEKLRASELFQELGLGKAASSPLVRRKTAEEDGGSAAASIPVGGGGGGVVGGAHFQKRAEWWKKNQKDGERSDGGRSPSPPATVGYGGRRRAGPNDSPQPWSDVPSHASGVTNGKELHSTGEEVESGRSSESKRGLSPSMGTRCTPHFLEGFPSSASGSGTQPTTTAISLSISPSLQRSWQGGGGGEKEKPTAASAERISPEREDHRVFQDRISRPGSVGRRHQSPPLEGGRPTHSSSSPRSTPNGRAGSGGGGGNSTNRPATELGRYHPVPPSSSSVGSPSPSRGLGNRPAPPQGGGASSPHPSGASQKEKEQLWKMVLREHTAAVQRHRVRQGSHVHLPHLTVSSGEK